jgi:hypothetical protein
MSVYSVACPGKEGHGGEPKLMFFMDKDGLILHCPKHKFLKFRFRKYGRSIYFGTPEKPNGIEVTASEMPKSIHFDHKPLPMLAYGKYELNGKHNS